MAVDLSSVVTFITSETVMFAALAFIAGMAGVISYHRLGSVFKRSDYKSDESVLAFLPFSFPILYGVLRDNGW